MKTNNDYLAPVDGRHTSETSNSLLLKKTHKEEKYPTSLARGCLIAKMAATMLRSLSKLGRPSTKLILNNNALSPSCTVLQNR